MAQRPVFMVGTDKNFYMEEPVDFYFFSGFSISQKRKSIESLHGAIKEKYPHAKILEVSRKGINPLGNKLSAFNLKLRIDDENEYYIENIFQSSKKFANGGPYRDLLNCSPVEAKKDQRLKESGPLTSFNFFGFDWPLEPKSFFYDFIYISAIAHNRELCEELLNYDTFTDIEFNPKVSFNCQARSVAIFVTLMKKKCVRQYLTDKIKFLEIYTKSIPEFELNNY